jgi:MFS family permease
MSDVVAVPTGYNPRRIWVWLCVGWIVSSADRTITGPVVTWMIQNKVGFMATANPYGLGGLIGSIFFAGYMLTQFPGGYAGDRHGHRSVIAISLFWAALATLLSGLAGGLAAFIAARIFTGLGEGAYYANDRTVIAQTTPASQRSLAMGVAITGLSIGITLATVGSAWLLQLGTAVLGPQAAWRMPFFVLAVLTALAAIGVRSELWRTRAPVERPSAALGVLAGYGAVFFVLVFGLFLLARGAGLPDWSVTLAELLLAFAMIGFVWRVMGTRIAGAIDRDLVLLYVAFIPVLWNLWFLGFWAVSIVAAGAGGSFSRAAATAMFTGLSGLIGFPVGGWLADRRARRGQGRRRVLLQFTLAQGLLTLVLAMYLQAGGQSAVVMAALLFFAGLFFSALQPVSQAMVADLAAPSVRGSAFGTYNLIGEIGAVLSPTISGTLRDIWGSWAPAVYLDAALILGSFVLLLFVNETARARAAVVAV